ncbi:MmgE/PrpD family protein [Phenylobacterium sp.]|uniref:MmgE/PrpD family protein n=1 Tax=Phenylobacterium sp. TaxID=1871053 RepID=UPI003BAC8040
MTAARDEAAPVGPALCAYIAHSQTAAIPESFLSLGRLHILDTLASIVACRDLAPARLARDFAIAQSGDAWQNAATILGTGATASLSDAAFASAMAAHGAEINDFIPSAFVQPGPAVVSVALALAEQRGLSGEAVLRAVITGYELAGRMPKALGIGNLRRAGIANHGIGPVFGAGAAAASILGLAEDRIPDVITYCVQQAGGSWQWLLDVEHVEKSFVFAGMGARAGLNAALMAEAGFTGVRDSLDHPEGWMRSAIFTGGDADRAGLIEGLGERTELIHTAYKRYPVGGPTQPAVKGLLDLLPDLDAKAVDGVRIEMPGRWQAFRDAAMPALNLRYLTAIMLIDRRLDFVSAQSLERMGGDAAVHALMAKVDVVHDPAQETPPGQPRTESARVIVRLKDGAIREVYVPHVTGFPSHPMDAGEVEAKALELMTPRLGAERAQAVVRAVAGIETLPQAAVLAQLIAT